MFRFCMTALLLMFLSLPVQAFTFGNIDGGTHDLDDWRGKPVLVVNTASLCAFTHQYDDLQKLHERFSDDGLIVLAVPSNDFRQELSGEAAVKDFCAMHFGLTLPMTEITSVTGRDAHPFYAWVRQTHGFEPHWNFNKVLLGRDGAVLATFGSNARPLGRRMVAQIERALAR